MVKHIMLKDPDFIKDFIKYKSLYQAKDLKEYSDEDFIKEILKVARI